VIVVRDDLFGIIGNPTFSGPEYPAEGLAGRGATMALQALARVLSHILHCAMLCANFIRRNHAEERKSDDRARAVSGSPY
jgi:hypothetical protein